MISDVLFEALEGMRDYDASPLYCDPPTRAMMDALKGHMQAVLSYLDAPPMILEHQANGKTDPQKVKTQRAGF